MPRNWHAHFENEPARTETTHKEWSRISQAYYRMMDQGVVPFEFKAVRQHSQDRRGKAGTRNFRVRVPVWNYRCASVAIPPSEPTSGSPRSNKSDYQSNLAARKQQKSPGKGSRRPHWRGPSCRPVGCGGETWDKAMSNPNSNSELLPGMRYY